KSGGLLAAALLASSLISSFAGETEVKSTGEKTVVENATDANPLSFLDGKVVFDLQERFRWEVRSNNYDFNSAVNSVTDDNWFLQRFRIGVMIKPSPWFRLYAQGQDSREINSDRADNPGVLGAEGDDAFDLRQGYIEIGNVKEFPLSLKVGRQILSYGDERLVGAFDWNNIGRTFDAAKLRWEAKSWWLDAFGSTVAVPTRGKYNQSDFVNGTETHRGQVFSGLYFSTTAVPVQTTDLYVFHLHENDNAQYLPTAIGDTNFFTLGFRVKSNPGAFAPQPPAPESDGKSVADGKTAPQPLPPKKPVGFDYDAEGAFQTGKVRGLDLTAFAVHGGLGYTFDVPWLPRVGIAYNYASGDSNPNDTNIETFQNLFPTNHKFYGQMDLFSWQNMHDLEVSVKAQPLKSVSLKAEFHAFWLASNEDVWYRANGTTAVRPLNVAAENANTYAGSEVDFMAQWNVTKNVALEAGYSHFFAGSYLRDTGAHDDADFGYVQATISF
ncbi:MAG: alginate export family protein, partial [Chthoniobacter sp.]